MSYAYKAFPLFLFVALSAGAAFGQAVDTEPLRNVQPLMEGWKFVQDDDLSDDEALSTAAEDWESVTLPHTWNAEDAASLESEGYKRGLGWYRLEFNTPAAGARHWLEIGAASLVADVWLNGEHLGQHKGAFTAFRFDVTDHLAAEGPNVLVVKANNKAPGNDDDVTAIAPLGGDFNVSGGLYRDVSLISTPDPAHFVLDDLGGPGVYAATTSIANGGATVNVRGKLSSNADGDGEFIVRYSLVDDQGQVAAAPGGAAVAVGQVDQLDRLAAEGRGVGEDAVAHFGLHRRVAAVLGLGPDQGGGRVGAPVDPAHALGDRVAANRQALDQRQAGDFVHQAAVGAATHFDPAREAAVGHLVGERALDALAEQEAAVRRGRQADVEVRFAKRGDAAVQRDDGRLAAQVVFEHPGVVLVGQQVLVGAQLGDLAAGAGFLDVGAGGDARVGRRFALPLRPQPGHQALAAG